ncbi:FecR family protein [Planctomicrobium piriforme]|uniref:FecR protein n=1 Tax=Planctomicrobium piriforme TaxID=1576369 RepID=A0A1I3GZB9_9PLAN|nr:hypothetical protein [Planctomicrobium piriforme]SFI28779.1 hypothetical protein SAMN05421753_107189 [Planctomicrobium piriforme]
MTDKTLPQEFNSLIDALLNDSITPAQHAQLQAILSDNPTAQAAYFEYIELHLGLKRLTALSAGPAPVSVRASEVPGSHRRSRRPLRGWRLAGTSLAALLLLAAIVLPKIFPPPAAPMAVVEQQTVPARQAIFSQIANAELFGEMMPAVHSELPFGRQYALIKGQVELQFPQGAKTVIQSPAVFLVESPDRLNLKIGGCSVHAPAGAEGFQVVTPRSEIVDLGTRFFVGVNDVGDAELQVIEGAAKIQTSDGGERLTQTIVKGEAVKAGNSRPEPQRIPFESEAYQPQLPDRVVSYEAAPVGAGPAVRDLVNVTVQRGGITRQYAVDELIGVDVLHFAAGRNTHNVTWDREYPADPASTLSGDVALTTGLLNPGGRREETAATPIDDFRQRQGLAIQFREPIKNGPGPDVVLFEIQSPIYPAEGDHFRVSPLQPEAGLHEHRVDRFDITLKSRDARQVAPFRLSHFQNAPKSLDDLKHPEPRSTDSFALPFSALAVGIDLSDLGYPPESPVAGLFFEDAGDDEHYFDPVFIAGLP